MSNYTPQHPKELVVFDFDGTCMDGNSPVQLVFYLWKKGMLRKRVMLKIGTWAFRYKFRLPQNEAWVRGLVFSAFEGMPKPQVDQFLRNFCDEEIVPLFRPYVDGVIAKHHREGREVLLVSASFEPIIDRIMELHEFDLRFATVMKVDQAGNYTRIVEGKPTEGEEKLRTVRRYADAKYGEGNWVIAYAYGDHHSDRALLRAAQNPCAVTPDSPLDRTARREGWDIMHVPGARQRKKDKRAQRKR